MRKSKITKLLLVLTFCFVTAFFGACGLFQTPFVPTLNGEEVFMYDENGNRVDQDGVFLSIDGATYYVVGNKIAKGYQVIEKSIYDFGEDGKMVVGEKDEFFFGEDGKMVGDKTFVVVNENTYYLVNNFIATYDMLIENSLYFFGEDGKMFVGELEGNVFGDDGKLVVNGDGFVVVNKNTYYIQNNVFVKGVFILDGALYNFGEDGKMFVGEKDGNVFGDDGKLVGNNVFVVINNNTYYIVNNIVVTGIIVIDGYIYDFGEDGKMFVGEKDGNVFGEDGKLVADKTFIVINNNTYYIVNNVVIKGMVIIENSFYYFDEDGKMFVGEKDGNVFGEDGKLVGNNTFVVVNNNTYYIVNNIVVTGVIIIDGALYDFGDDGKMFVGEKDGYTFGSDGKLIGNEIFVVINNNTYYIENNVTVTNTLKVIDNRLYVFDENGKQVTSGEYGDIEFDEDGNIVGDCVEITVGGNTYYVINNVVVSTVTVQGVVYESDNDFDPTNNAKVANVACEARIGEKVFTATTNANGEYVFTGLPATEITFTFTCNGYFPASIVVDCSILTGNYTVVIDKQVSNTLTGKVVQADADTNASNNSPLAGATLTLTRTSSTNVWEYTAETSSSGTYSFTNLTAGVYTLTIEKEGYLTITQTVQVRHNETTVQNVMLEAIPVSGNPEEVVQNGTASGKIIDGRTGNAIAGLTVYVYAGVNNIFGDALCQVTTDASGVYTTTELAPGNYTAYVVDERELTDEDERYASVTIAVKVLPGQNISGQGTNTSNSKGMNIDGMRIVLTWGASPSDLDSHLNITSSGRNWHVYYSQKNPSGAQANLDLDDTSSYGPETTTIVSIKENATYQYYVYNYSSGGYSSYALSDSGATINVYFGGTATPAYTFNVPYAYGCYWNVFTYNSATGEFKVVNTVTGNVSF